MNNPDPITPVITLDGPTASGKGTVAHGVARILGWHVLDSGALYRLTALAALRRELAEGDISAIACAAERLDVRFEPDAIVFENEDVTKAIRSEVIGNLASRIAAWPSVREALLRLPGLVADGRDMGSIVFPDAALKIFLVSDVAVRAQRRYKQLIDKGISATFTDLLADLSARDARDANRATAPLKAAPGAITLDSSTLTIDETVARVIDLWRQRASNTLS